VSRLTEELGRRELSVELFTTRDQSDAPALAPQGPHSSTTFATGSSALARIWRFWRLLAGQAQDSKAEIIHAHGLWQPTSLLSAVVAYRYGIPLVVTTRGMLEPWALNHHKWRKKLAWHVYQRRALASAQVSHATSTMEAENLRTLGFDQPIAVIPNGVPLPDQVKKQASPDGPRTALFLSRIHPKKGLPMLLDAWDEVRPEGWRLVLAGPSEDGHRAELEQQVQRLGLGNVVSFPGTIPDDEKWQHYRSADLFVLPTHSENFGIVVAEALASGVPVITTKGAPWQELETRDCGWWTEVSVGALGKALREAMALSDEERLAMGHRGRALVEERYSWQRIAEQMRNVYRWILGEATRPNYVNRGLK
jgi:glycosyltransferase involved in cell wall biosynthesis